MAHRHIERAPIKNYVWFLVHRRELIDQTVATFDAFGIPRDNVFIGMVQTITRDPSRYRAPTLIIFDEAHHAKAKSWYNIITYFANTPMIGLTATPVRLDGKPLGDIFDTIVTGPDADTLTAEGYLCEYDYYAPRYDDLTFVTRGMDYDVHEFGTMLMQSKIYGDIAKYIDTARKTIIYAPSIEFSMALVNLVGAVHFDGNTPKATRDRIIMDFRTGKIRVLTNVDLIGEGFDVPDCDTVILLRPTKSLSLYIQQAMRCMRPGVGKRATVYDLVGNVHRHGMPTEARQWSLTTAQTVRNESAEPDIIVRQCGKCYRCYGGVSAVCPYCGHNNGKTRRQIDHDNAVELERITAVERRDSRRQQGRAQSYDELVRIGTERGYKNPRWWAKMIIKSRKMQV